MKYLNTKKDEKSSPWKKHLISLNKSKKNRYKFNITMEGGRKIHPLLEGTLLV